MCNKIIYHNTYGDGLKDVTERVEPCTSGYICSNPRIVEYDCEFERPRRDAKPTQTRIDRPLPASPKLYPPTPRSASPSSPSFRSRRPEILVNGTKMSSSPTGRASVYTAPEPPTFNTRPIPIKRTSTIPRGLETPPPERSRWPIVVEDRVPRGRTSASPSVPVDVLEHASSSRLRRRQSKHGRQHHRDDARAPTTPDDDTFLSPHHHHHHHHHPLPGYGSAEDEHDSSERSRRRLAARKRASVTSASLPAYGNTNAFGTSYDSPIGSAGGYGSSSTTSSYGSANSPAVAAVKKELRWEDQQRQKQNENINMRPKLSRSQSVKDNAKLQGDVKSILKNGSVPSAPTTPVDGRSPAASPQPSPRNRRASVSTSPNHRASDMDDMFSSFAGLGIHGRGASPVDHGAEAAAGREYRDRLRERFSMPPRRYTASGSSKRRTEVWYPDEGVYRFM